MAEYVAELRSLATTCKFSVFLEEALYNRLVCGLKEEAKQHRLLAEPDTDLNKTCDLAQGMEVAAVKSIQKSINTFSCISLLRLLLTVTVTHII